MPYCYLNKEFIPANQAHISIQDRGLLLADGLFTTLRSYPKHLFAFKLHWKRLKMGAELMRIPFEITPEQLHHICQQLLGLNKLTDQDSSLRITLTRGSNPPGHRGLTLPKTTTPTLLIQNYPLDGVNNASIRLNINANYKFHPTPLSAFKTLNYLERILARQEGLEHGFDDVLLQNSSNQICSSSCANIFIIKNKQLYTPPITCGIINGIMRQTLLKLAQGIHIPIHLAHLVLNDLYSADEVFLTNSLIEIQSVQQIDQIFYKIDQETASVTQQLKIALKKVTYTS